MWQYISYDKQLSSSEAITLLHIPRVVAQLHKHMYVEYTKTHMCRNSCQKGILF